MYASFTHPEKFPDENHLGPRDVAPVVSQTPEGSFVAREVVRVIALLRMFTQLAQIEVLFLCETKRKLKTASFSEASRTYSGGR